MIMIDGQLFERALSVRRRLNIGFSISAVDSIQDLRLAADELLLDRIGASAGCVAPPGSLADADAHCCDQNRLRSLTRPRPSEHSRR